MPSRHDIPRASSRSGSPAQRIFFSIYGAVLGVCLVLAGWVYFLLADPWQTGDWLINYRGGFVRRGLPGEIALRVGHLLHVGPSGLICMVQLACYGLLFYSIFGLMRRSSWRYWVLLTLYSPVTLAFPVLGPVVAFRKEILLIAGLGFLLRMLLAPVRDTTLALYALVLAVVCVLSHEGLIVYLVYLFAALAIGLNSIARTIRISIVPAAATLAAMFAVGRHPGDEHVSRAICASLGYAFTNGLPAPCQGAIEYLGRDQAFAHQDMAANALKYHYATLYPVVALLALLPILLAFVTLWRKKTLHRPLIILSITSLVSISASSILFVYGYDWGRWIYIHVICISLLLLFIDSRSETESGLPAPSPSPTSSRSFALTVALVLFATCWNLPPYGEFFLRFGYLGLLRHFVHAP